MATTKKITTIIFDVDDTLYDVGTGFTAHRNTEGATSFMVQKLNFPSKEAAQKLRDVYFRKYHSTAKALTAAEADGVLPPLPEGVSLPDGQSKRFDPEHLDEFWANNLDFSILGGPDPECIEMFNTMSEHKLDIVAFSNGPRKYISRVLKEIGLISFIPPEKLFAVNDVLPYCKPEKESFQAVLDRVGVKAEECIMVEDSMKNIHVAKSMGMKTILVCGKGRRKQHSGCEGGNVNSKGADAAEATKAGDAPDETDPAVDAVVEVASEVKDVLKDLMN
jgi:putative hydrolase of the HAD superfamily